MAGHSSHTTRGVLSKSEDARGIEMTWLPFPDVADPCTPGLSLSNHNGNVKQGVEELKRAWDAVHPRMRRSHPQKDGQNWMETG